MNNPHLTDEKIARFIEGTLGIPDKLKVIEHLRSCNRCFEIFQDSSIYQGLWASGTSEFDSTGELVDAGRAVASISPPFEVMHDEENRSRSRPWFKKQLRLRMMAACGAIVLVIGVWGLWPGNIDRDGNTDLSIAVLSPVKTAVEKASRLGPIVLPEGEASLGIAGAIYRSGYIPLSDTLTSSLTTLYDAYQQGDSSNDVAYWLVAGYVATGQIDAARDIVSSAREQHPGESRITTLEALIAFFDGDYDRSEALLREVLTMDPDDPVAGINLAIIMGEQGNSMEAKKILSHVLERHAGTPLAGRARSILEGLQEQ